MSKQKPTLRSPDQKLIEEWCDADVTLYLVQLLHQRLNGLNEHVESLYAPSEPSKTQEAFAYHFGCKAVLIDLIDAIETKDFKELEEPEDSEEHIGNPPVR